MRRWRAAACALLLVLSVPLAGCVDDWQRWGDPLTRSTFQGTDSNGTTWALTLTGEFHLAPGTRAWLQVLPMNETCATGVLEPGDTQGCRDDHGNDTHEVRTHDHDLDGRIGRGDRLELARRDGATLNGTYVLVLGLHEAVPLFTIEQRFADGPAGRLDIAIS